jgi:hypothetical protein
MADKQALGARADLFAAHNSKQAHDVVAAVAAVPLLETEGEDTTVAAVRPGVSCGQRGGGGGQRGGSWRRKKKPVCGGGGGGSGQQHFCFGAKAREMPSSLNLVRKLGGPGRLNANAAGQLIHMLDQISNRSFLVDTGASYSILPPCRGSQAVWPGRSAHSLLGRPPGAAVIPGSVFSWKFLLADVAFPILVVDFLRTHKLLIDPDGHALLDSTGRPFAGQLGCSPPTATVVVGFVQPYKPIVESPSSAHTAGAGSAGAASAGAASAGAASAGAAIAGAASAGAASAGAASAGAASVGAASTRAANTGPASKQNPTQPKAAYSRLLKEFPAVVCASKRLPPVSHDVVHHIFTQGLPIASKFRKLDGEKLAAVKAEFKQLEEDDIIQRSTSLWSSPLHMVRKADGSWQPCGISGG